MFEELDDEVYQAIKSDFDERIVEVLGGLIRKPKIIKKGEPSITLEVKLKMLESGNEHIAKYNYLKMKRRMEKEAKYGK